MRVQHKLACNWLQVVNLVEGCIQFFEAWQGIESIQACQSTVRNPQYLQTLQGKWKRLLWQNMVQTQNSALA